MMLEQLSNLGLALSVFVSVALVVALIIVAIGRTFGDELTVDAGKVARDSIIIRVRGLKLLGLRSRIAAVIFRLGAFVAGVGIEIDLKPDAPDLRHFGNLDEVNGRLA